ncbi:MAG: M20 family metallopeptidase [Firmicutes bacterium]|nr:M20 family metallopeptidase [Bacillota bacterium]
MSVTTDAGKASYRIETLKQRAIKKADALAPALFDLSDRIYHNPELGYAEHKASRWLTEFLSAHGFTVDHRIAGLETSFRAVATGRAQGPVVALLAEYDALPEIGHGCGHNAIGVAACGAAAALSAVLPELKGSVLVLGCPAEEGAVDGAGGKVVLVRNGEFDAVDAAMMVHPASRFVVVSSSAARVALKVIFSGSDPQSAALLAFNGMNALRQQFQRDVMIHGILKRASAVAVHGEDAPGACEIRVYVRASDSLRLSEWERKVRECIRGAAFSADCEAEIGYTSPTYEELVTNQTLAGAFIRNLRYLGATVDEPDDSGIGSTDMGNVSHVAPALHAYVATCPRGVAGHTREFGRATLTREGHQGLLLGAKALAMTVIDLVEDEELLKRVKGEFEALVRR